MPWYCTLPWHCRCCAMPLPYGGHGAAMAVSCLSWHICGEGMTMKWQKVILTVFTQHSPRVAIELVHACLLAAGELRRSLQGLYPCAFRSARLSRVARTVPSHLRRHAPWQKKQLEAGGGHTTVKWQNMILTVITIFAQDCNK